MIICLHRQDQDSDQLLTHSKFCVLCYDSELSFRLSGSVLDRHGLACPAVARGWWVLLVLTRRYIIRETECGTHRAPHIRSIFE